MFEELLKKCDKLMSEMQELKVKIDELDKKLNNKQSNELPCKVGDKIYILYNSYNHIKYRMYEDKIVDIMICNDDIIFNTNVFTNHIENYNNTWFTDRELAKKKLKELNDDK